MSEASGAASGRDAAEKRARAAGPGWRQTDAAHYSRQVQEGRSRVEMKVISFLYSTEALVRW